jgi:hypothetical protein
MTIAARRRVTFTWALAGALLLAGCGIRRSPKDAWPGEPRNAIERKAEKGPVKLSVRVWPREPGLSDLVEMDVTVESQPGVEIRPPAFGQAVGDFLIRDYSERTPGPAQKGARRFHYQLEPVAAGKHLIRSVSIAFVDNRPNAEHKGEAGLIETEPLEVTVTSELAGALPSLANLEPMLPPQPVPRSVGILWLLSLGGAAVLVLVLTAVVGRRKHRPIAPRRQSAEEIAQAALAQLLVENLPERGLFKLFYVRLTGIVRQYVEDTTGIRAPEQTTEEFLRDIRSRPVFLPERSLQFAEFLEAADLVKYAGQEPGEGQVEQAISRAREFVKLKPAEAVVMAGAGAR